MSGPEVFRPERAGEDGWSEWIHPMPGYRMACCDCNLVHDLEFRLDDLNQLNFRVSRNDDSTASLRAVNPQPTPDIELARIEGIEEIANLAIPAYASDDAAVSEGIRRYREQIELYAANARTALSEV